MNYESNVSTRWPEIVSIVSHVQYELNSKFKFKFKFNEISSEASDSMVKMGSV